MICSWTYATDDIEYQIVSDSPYLTGLQPIATA